jgi:serine/threonine protein kinase
MSPSEAIEVWDSELTQFELGELPNFGKVYAPGSVRVHSKQQITAKDGQYKITAGESIAYRYLVEQVVDAGAFGQVCKCVDLGGTGEAVAIKISKDQASQRKNAQYEARILERFSKDAEALKGVVRMIEHFDFRGFYIIVFELLEKNIYRHINQPRFKGFTQEQLKAYAK